MTTDPRRAGALLLLPALLLAACTGGVDPAPPEATATAEPEARHTSAPAPDPAPTTDEAAVTTAADPGPVLGAAGVAAGHQLAADAGMEMLEAGGTAADAAVAAALVDSVMQPHTSGLGGGGAAVVLTDGVAQSYDYREEVSATGVIPPSGTGVPGYAAGLGRLHADHGVLPWESVVAPAVEVATEGGPVSGFLSDALADFGLPATEGMPQFRRSDGSPVREGDLLIQEDLAATLRTLAAEGPGSFYSGSLAEPLLQEPGLDAASLADYEVVVSEPPRGQVGEHVLLSAAPALPGAALVQLAQVAEAAGIGDVDPYSPEFVDLQSRAWTVANESVQTVLGDPRFVDVPVDSLTDAERNAGLADELLATGSADDAVSAGLPAYEGGGNTTHVAVVDEDGNAVSMTNTITHYWGSGRSVGGYFLNDQLTRFEAMGRTEANRPEAGRRSVSWSAPSMLLDDQGRAVLVLGTPGGQQIPNTIAAAVLRWSLHGEGLEAIVRAPRFVLAEGEMALETGDLAAPLQDLGYAVRVVDPSLRSDFGSLQVLEVDWEGGVVSSVADDRRSAGFRVSGP
ncbi:gamma-glutamyltransferase [Ornithinimicrobium cerasi]|uniref:gamma-glutamyltransferase n=1 Tax=Ornithinimicrobium cerasi TaxID=2248773 RepID=UPI000F000787|nr:gamma-glutamyltransferase [Ornithinimicrobium cerasi]